MVDGVDLVVVMMSLFLLILSECYGVVDIVFSLMLLFLNLLMLMLS